MGFLSQTHAFSKIHAVFSDGLAERGKQLLHAVASPFPGHMALNIGVFYISLSIDVHTGSGHRIWRCSGAASMGCILGSTFERSLTKS
jgi:hypothetical protein